MPAAGTALSVSEARGPNTAAHGNHSKELKIQAPKNAAVKCILSRGPRVLPWRRMTPGNGERFRVGSAVPPLQGAGEWPPPVLDVFQLVSVRLPRSPRQDAEAEEPCLVLGYISPSPKCVAFGSQVSFLPLVSLLYLNSLSCRLSSQHLTLQRFVHAASSYSISVSN